MTTSDFIGIGLYTPAEAARLIKVPAGKIVRWLKGHAANGKTYGPLWQSQIDFGDGAVYLGFRDLIEMRAAHAFMEMGISAVMIRRAILEARTLINDTHPLSTTKFRTDGYSIFVELLTEDGDSRLLDIFKRQYAFRKILEQGLKDVEFDGIAPGRWWPVSQEKKIVVDPARSFGQPIDEETGIPTARLVAAVKAEGSVDAAARVWAVKPATLRRAMDFEADLVLRAA